MIPLSLSTQFLKLFSHLQSLAKATDLRMHRFSDSGRVGRDGLVTYRAESGERGAGEKREARKEEGVGVACCGGRGVCVVGSVGVGGPAATDGAGAFELVPATNLKSSKERTHENAAVRWDFISSSPVV